jgi:hypothetical protein
MFQARGESRKGRRPTSAPGGSEPKTGCSAFLHSEETMMTEKGPRPIANYVFIALLLLALVGAINFTWRMTVYATGGGLS